jgi:lysozyme family protein
LNHLTTVIADLIKREGDYVDHPSDRGGPTRWGITLATARAFGYLGAIEHLPVATAEKIYRERFWYQPNINMVAAISPLLGEELLDTGVNMHPSVASKFLQRALNTLNRRGRDFQDITVDGAIGRMTIYALKTFLDKRGQAGELVLFGMCNAQQSVRYMEIAENKESQEDFEFGWQNNRVVVTHFPTLKAPA